MIKLLLMLLCALSPMITWATTTDTYRQNASDQKIKLHQPTNVIKAKINHTKPLPYLNRPTIRATAFHLQQYKRALKIIRPNSGNQSQQN